MIKNPVVRLLACLLLVALVLTTTKAFAAEIVVSGEGLEVSLAGGGSLFAVENFAPGEQVSSGVVVKNQGEDFSLSISAMLEWGNELYYDSLLLSVAGENGSALYEGSLSGLDNMVITDIAAGSAEELELIVKFPESGGNELQGAAVSVQFTFMAVDSEYKEEVFAPESPGIGWLPLTGIDNLRYLLMGGFLLATGLLLLRSQLLLNKDKGGVL